MSLKTDQEKYSYAIGMDVCENLTQQDLNLDLAAFLQGVQDAFKGGETLLDEEQKDLALRKLQQTLQARHAERAQAASAENIAAGKAFLEANKAAEGIQVTASGLQYKVIQTGDGATPTLQDTVTTHYRGTLINGKEFDSSYRRGEPATFPVNGVIPGWTEALQLMTVGSKWQLFIPSDLAYGPRGAGQDIEPHSTLVFDIELLAIK
ncbi:MAG: FKBP-type peptidyl-prolyl cis-trans isomerase [Holophagaceae bacterium]|nr:FKBP-type peptidyl-prolyl cis-trans isomerase [Holophagaceae bacterium]